MTKHDHFDTQLIHTGELRPRVHGAVSLPIYQSATFEGGGAGEGYHDIRYIRLNNTPNHDVLHGKLAALEGGEAALVTASGMAAITTAMLSVLVPGGHVLIQESLYGGTLGFVLDDLPAFGIEVDFIDSRDPDSWVALRKANTRAIYVEAMSNPMMEIPDLAAVTAFAREHGLVSMIDATFASPVNFRPLENGFDLVLHSATKYLNGHSDIVAGVIAGGVERITAIRHRLDHLGGSLDPHACFLLHRGLKTLGLRVERQNDNAQRIAEALDRHDAVEAVHYPGLAHHPDHATAKRYFAGCGGVLSFRPKGGVELAARVVEQVRLFVSAPSLGGVESLITRPVTTSHAGIEPAIRRRLGITDDLIRLAVGIEHVDDLIADLDQALASAKEAR
ncbi:MAG: PLP-dependent transferase [Acidobacteriota bacterium]